MHHDRTPGRSAPIILVAALVVLTAMIAAGIVTAIEARRETRWQRHIAEIRATMPTVVPLEGPFVVAVQPGHWKIDEVPAEIRRRPRGPGASYAGVRELDINLAVVAELVPLLEAEGWTVIVVPATVPPGLRADAFISIHADWAGDLGRSGWKLAPPWRPSSAASALSEALKSAFRDEGLREDVGGVTTGMRGYFGFSSHRYHHASSPYTPAVLVELGFVTNAADRARMTSDPAYYARVLHRGLERYRYSIGRPAAEALVPRTFENLIVGPGGAAVLRTPEPGAREIRRLEPGSVVSPVDAIDGWYEVRMRDPGQIGWVHAAELVASGRSPERGGPNPEGS